MRWVHWFRNDLRLRDNRALAEAARRADELFALFVFDERLLRSPATGAPRVRFLLDCLTRLAADLDERGIPLLVRRGDPRREVPRALAQLSAQGVGWNRDTAPFARRRDAAVARAARAAGVRVLECKDRVVFEAGEVRTRAGGAYGVYTPYRRAWRARLEQDPQPPRPAPRLPAPRQKLAPEALPDAAALGFGGDAAELPTGGERAARRRLRSFLAGPVARYAEDRDRPAVDGTSRLSPHLRFGTISVRECVAAAREAAAAEPGLARGAQKWLDELVWREFYAGILEQEPRVLREAWRAPLRDVEWDDDDEAFAAWCQGRTGHPLVDAAMRQLAATGWVHNRARMVAASFLAKDLLIDWRRGERWFFQRLVDGDPASNNGGWQWSAGTGTDAAPYFRVLNPVAQGERHDPAGAYVRRFVPELAGLPDRLLHRPWEAPRAVPGYPAPIVDHAERREEALARYRRALARYRRALARQRRAGGAAA
jgi:deoxyribodipyrimidine photo-lyase